jgi:hypothetical protein
MYSYSFSFLETSKFTIQLLAGHVFPHAVLASRVVWLLPRVHNPEGSKPSPLTMLIQYYSPLM